MHMKELKCPKCGNVFTVDESDYADIVNQVKTKEFQAEVDRRMKEMEDRQALQQQADSLKAEQQLQAKQLEFAQELAAKDNEISSLKVSLAEGEAKIRVAVLEAQNKSKDELQQKEQKIAQLRRTTMPQRAVRVISSSATRTMTSNTSPSCSR